MKNIIILGPPNSGKGTQAEKLVAKLSAVHFSAGDLIRGEIEKGSALGKEFEKYASKGELIPSEVLDNFFAKEIEAIQDKLIVFDGFPRIMSQVKLLEKVLPNKNLLLLNIHVRPDILLDRMEKRRICSGCDKVFIVNSPESQKTCDECGGELVKREDDNPKALKARIDAYNEETREVVDFFQKLHEVVEINGEQSIEEVEREIWEKINGKN